MVPYERNHFFIGRDSFLKKLSDKFRANNDESARYYGRIALFGMGGIGKTQAALEFVYRSQIFYNRIYWISAVTQESLLDGYQKMGKRANIPLAPDSKPISIAEQVLSWLKRTPNWLLVVDNLDDIDVLSTDNIDESNIVDMLLPQSGPGQHTLITTRNPNADHIPAHALEVPLFEESDSVDLLSTLSDIPISPKSEEEKAAQQIAKELGNLPLAISQAGAYIKQISGSFVNYIKHYTEYRSLVNAWIPKGPQSYPHSVATTWIMSFNEIRKHNPTAAYLFRLLAFLNPDGIMIEFLKSGVEVLDDDLERLVSNEFELSQALLSFETFSLIKWDRQSRSVLIHRLVQTVVKDEMSDSDSKALGITIIKLCDRSFPQEWINENRELCRIYVGQIMRSLLDVKVIRTEKSASLMYRVGWFLRDDGKISDSERLSWRASEISAEILGPEHAFTLTTMGNLASTYGQQGRTGEAAALAEEVLQKRRRILGDDHPDTLTAMGNLALTYWQQGRTGEAAALEEEVLQKWRRILGDDHPDTLTTMGNLALTYWQQGRTGEAAALGEEVLQKRRRILGDDHPDTLTTMGNLALTYRAAGEDRRGGRARRGGAAEAAPDPGRRSPGHADDHEQPRVDVLAAGEDRRGGRARRGGAAEAAPDPGRRPPGHADGDEQPRVTYRQQGRTGEAAALEEEVLQKRRRILGDDHPDTLTAMNNLALTYWRQGRTGEAAALEEEVLQKRRRILGDDHPDTLTAMGNLARRTGSRAGPARRPRSERRCCRSGAGSWATTTRTR